MAVDVDKLLQSDEFLNLEPEAKREVLGHAVPGFKDWDKDQQDKIIKEYVPGYGIKTRIMRQIPSAVGMLELGARGMTLGAEIGEPAGPLGIATGAVLGGLGGAYVGAGETEALKAAADKYILHNVQGDADLTGPGGLVERTKEAAGEGLTAQAVGEMAGPPIRYVGGKLKDIGSAAYEAVKSRIPLSVLEGAKDNISNAWLDWLSNAPGAAGVFKTAAKDQGARIIQYGNQLLDQFPEEAASDYGTAATKISRSLRDSAKALVNAANDPADLRSLGDLGMDDEITSLKEALSRHGATPANKDASLRAVERVFKEGDLAQKLAKDPAKWAQTIKDLGSGDIDELRKAWWTGVLDSATGKEGRLKGLIDPSAIYGAWDKLGTQGQQRLFGDLTPNLEQFVDSVRPAEVSRLEFAKARNMMSKAGTEGALDKFLKYGGGPLSWAGLATVLSKYFKQTPLEAGIEAGSIFTPWLAAKLLVTKGGAELTSAMLHHQYVGTMTDAAPYLTAGLTKVLSQENVSTLCPEVKRALAEPALQGVEMITSGHTQGGGGL